MNGLFLACLAINALEFFLMGWDKRQARKGGRRTPEKTFFLLALLGGSPGAIFGMYAFRHKTRHWYFKWGLPAILLLQLAAVWFAWEYGVERLASGMTEVVK